MTGFESISILHGLKDISKYTGQQNTVTHSPWILQTMTCSTHTWVQLDIKQTLYLRSWQCKVCLLPTDTDVCLHTYSSSRLGLDNFRVAVHVCERGGWGRWVWCLSTQTCELSIVISIQSAEKPNVLGGIRTVNHDMIRVGVFRTDLVMGLVSPHPFWFHTGVTIDPLNLIDLPPGRGCGSL